MVILATHILHKSQITSDDGLLAAASLLCELGDAGLSDSLGDAAAVGTTVPLTLPPVAAAVLASAR